MGKGEERQPPPARSGGGQHSASQENSQRGIYHSPPPRFSSGGLRPSGAACSGGACTPGAGLSLPQGFSGVCFKERGGGFPTHPLVLTGARSRKHAIRGCWGFVWNKHTKATGGLILSWSITKSKYPGRRDAITNAKTEEEIYVQRGGSQQCPRIQASNGNPCVDKA